MGEKIYDISKFELIGRLPHYDGKQLSVSKNSQGYSRVLINKKATRLHRLIAERYIPNPQNHPIVDHEDEDKDNNSVDNLNWVSYSENSKKAYHAKTTMKIMSEYRGGKAIISEKDGVIKEHESLRKCATYLGRNSAAVHRVLKGEWNKCAGHTLTYKKIEENVI
jgi:hypothetical protein